MCICLKRGVFFGFVIAVFGMFGTVSETHAKVIKFATLLPNGGPGYEDMATSMLEIKKETGGEVDIRIYGGGVAGDEMDVIRKMRSKLIHMAAFSGFGIGTLMFRARVLELVGHYNSYEEFDYIRETIFDELARDFETKGYVLLGLADAGFANIFSKYDPTGPDGLAPLKMWIWKGEPVTEILAGDLGMIGIPLHIADVNMALSRNMVDTYIATTMVTTAFQWSSNIRYMLDYPIGVVMGGMVIEKQTFDSLSKKAQEIVRVKMKKNAEDGARILRQINVESRQHLIDAGVKVVPPNKLLLDRFEQIYRQSEHDIRNTDKYQKITDEQEALAFREKYIRVKELIKKYRQEHPK